MSKRLMAVLACLWIISLIGIATLAAQVATQPVTPKILSGSDVGFRVERIDAESGSVVGHVVVKVNGRWVDARLGGGTVKLTP